MPKEISRTFRPNFHDLEVWIEDDFGIQRPVYIGLQNGPDVDLEIRNLITESQRRTDQVKKSLIEAGVEHDQI